MKQTAVEWLVNEMPVIDWQQPYWKIKLEKAKEMEKEQIIEAIRDTEIELRGYYNDGDAEYYYNKTFKSE